MSTALAIDLEDYERREFADPIAVAVENVRRRGDAALGPGSPMPLRLGAAELDQCLDEMPALARADLRLVQEQTRAIAAAERAGIADVESRGPDGATVGTRHVPVGSVGICLPDTLESGHAHIAAQSGAIAARIAGVERVLACVPAPAGRPDPSLVAALVLAGVNEIYRCAGARAFAALRLGTETIPRVDVAYAVVDPELEEADHVLGGSVDRTGGHGLLI